MRRCSHFALSLVLAALLAPAAVAGEMEIDSEGSIIAIVTHKAGIGSGLAHDHLVAAGSPEVRLDFEASDPAATRFDLETAAADLVFDDPDLQKRWYPRLEALGILDEAFSEIGEKDRGKIRQSALGPKQLDAENHPRIVARLLELKEEATTLGTVEMTYQAQVEVTIHGETVSRAVPLRTEEADGAWTFEAAAPFRFSDFGIKPYSAMLGAVRNDDEFHVYVSLRAGSAPGAEPAEGDSAAGQDPSLQDPS